MRCCVAARATVASVDASQIALLVAAVLAAIYLGAAGWLACADDIKLGSARDCFYFICMSGTASTQHVSICIKAVQWYAMPNADGKNKNPVAEAEAAAEDEFDVAPFEE